HRQTAGSQINAAKFRRGSNAHRLLERELSTSFQSRARTRSQVRLAQSGGRAVPIETATGRDTRTTKVGCPHKRHLPRKAVFAILPAALVAHGVGASFRAKDSVSPAPEAVRCRRSRWGWS